MIAQIKFKATKLLNPAELKSICCTEHYLQFI
jgi:hypothetical protein